MGCQASNLDELHEIYLENDLPPTVISSLNCSTIPSISSPKSKHSIYTHSKFLKIKSIVTKALNTLTNFPQVSDLLNYWEFLVLRHIESLVEVPSEISLSVCESTKPEVTINLQADGIRKFEFLRVFLRKIKKICKIELISEDIIKENIEFIKELAPLTVNFYLVLGKDIDFGIGVNKPIDRKNLSKFLQNTSDRKTITEWSYIGNPPIPTSMQFSCMKLSKSCSFYIFDGEKNENFQKAFSIFDCIGVPIEKPLKKCFFSAKSQEAHCKIQFELEKISEVSVDLTQMPLEEFLTAADLLQLEIPHKHPSFSEKVSLQFDKAGMNLIKYSDI